MTDRVIITHIHNGGKGRFSFIYKHQLKNALLLCEILDVHTLLESQVLDTVSYL